MDKRNQIVRKIKDFFSASGCRGVVVGISGGIDSALTAFLLAEALGKDKVVGLILPNPEITSNDSIEAAKLISDFLGIDSKVIEIGPFLKLFQKLPWTQNKTAKANLNARVRAVILYNFANSKNFLVAGTGNKSEFMTGYFTKYGDGAADFFPIGDLYKTDVFEMAREIGVPDKIVKRTPSAELWVGQSDEEDLGVSYKELDVVLKALSEQQVCGGPGLNKIKKMVEKARHKREHPPIFRVS